MLEMMNVTTQPENEWMPMLDAASHTEHSYGSSVPDPGQENCPFERREGIELDLSPVKLTPQVDDRANPRLISSSQLKIHACHDAAAHRILEQWPMIAVFNPEGASSASDETCIWSPEGLCVASSAAVVAPGESHHFVHTNFGPHQLPSHGSWESLAPMKYNFDPVDPEEISPGGFNETGSCQLDDRTISRLKRSYLRNVHSLYPFLDMAAMTEFSVSVVPASAAHATYSESPLSVTDDFIRSVPKPSHDDISRPNGRKAPRELQNSMNAGEWQTLDMALLLLMCALGRVCEVEGEICTPHFLPGKSKAMQNRYSPESCSSQSFAHSFSRTSNLFHQGSLTIEDVAERYLSHSATWESWTTSEENMTSTAGLSYYTIASSILRNNSEPLSFKHVAAYLMCGLYMGKLVRVVETYGWVHTAANACSTLCHR